MDVVDELDNNAKNYACTKIVKNQMSMEIAINSIFYLIYHLK